MWNKFKHWLRTADGEGLTGFDAICMTVWNLIAWGLFFIGAFILR